MKTSSLPPLRVSPELRREVESLLEAGESLSAFVHDAVARSVQFRRAQREFLAVGLERAAQAEATGKYVAPEAVVRRLRNRLARAKAAARK